MLVDDDVTQTRHNLIVMVLVLPFALPMPLLSFFFFVLVRLHDNCQLAAGHFALLLLLVCKWLPSLVALSILLVSFCCCCCCS